MNEEEKIEFKNEVISQVNERLSEQYESNRRSFEQLNRDIGERLEVVLPRMLKETSEKPNYWFPILNSLLNGVAVGLAIYLVDKI